MNYSKLRKKLLRMSLIILGLYVVAVIMNPTSWIVLLPIIIPAVGLTIGIPTYAIIRYTKESLENSEFKQSISKDNEISHIYDDKTKEIVFRKQFHDDYIQIAEYSEEMKQEKIKIKSKGTMH